MLHGYGCSFTVILNNTQDFYGFANYSRVFISNASVLLLIYYQEIVCQIFSVLYGLHKVILNVKLITCRSLVRTKS